MADEESTSREDHPVPPQQGMVSEYTDAHDPALLANPWTQNTPTSAYGAAQIPLRATSLLPTAAQAPMPPHVPPRSTSIHSGSYDYISSNPDDEAAVLTMLDMLLDSSFDVTANNQVTALVTTMMGATPAQIRQSGNSHVLDVLADAGYLDQEGYREDIQAVVERNYEDWTPEQKAMYTSLSSGLDEEVPEGGATLPSTVTQMGVESVLSRMRSIWPDLTLDPEAGSQIRGAERVLTNPDAPLAELLNDSFFADQQPGLKDLADQVVRSGGSLLSYDQWLAAGRGKDSEVARQEYQDMLLRETYVANEKYENPEDFIYYDWDPDNPGNAVAVERGTDIDPVIAAELTSVAAARKAMTESAAEGITTQQVQDPETGQMVEMPITVEDAAAFSKSMFGNTAYGAQMSADLQATLASHGFDVPLGQIEWGMSTGYGAYPTIAGAGGLTFGGVDPNTLPEGAVEEIAQSITLNVTDPDLQALLDEAREDPNLMGALSYAVQQRTTQDPTIAGIVETDVARYTSPEVLTGLSINYHVQPNFGQDVGSYRMLGVSSPFRPIESPGFNLNFTKAQEAEISTMLGGSAYGSWGAHENLTYLMTQAESRGIPWEVAATALGHDTQGFSQRTDSVAAKEKINGVLDELTMNMASRNNSALALIGFFFSPDMAERLQTIGHINPTTATHMYTRLNDYYDQMKALNPFFYDPNLEQALLALQNNAAYAGSSPVEQRLTDPEKVKEGLRSVYESLLIPVTEEQLDGFASQFQASEIAAYAPAVNAYNQGYRNSADYFTQTPSAYGSTYTGEWMFPVQGQGVSFSDDFGNPRSGHTHGGTDIMAPQGTAVVTPVEGEITDVGGDSGDGGIRIWVRGNDGNLYYFAHLLSTLGSYVGQHVGLGQQIGLVGATGNAAGGAPHLHFEIHTNGQKNAQSNDPGSSGRINPFPLLDQARAEGVTSVTPWDSQTSWDEGQWSEAAGFATGPSSINIVMPDLQARAMAAARKTALYKELFAEKPEGIADVEWAAGFAQQAQTAAGVPSPTAARIGMTDGSLEAMWGAMVGDVEAQDESPTLRSRMFSVGNDLTRAMGGRR